MGLWSGSAASASAFGAAPRRPGHLEAVERVKDWTRARFALGDGDTIVVSETSRTLPGWPATETVVGFWTDDGVRHHFRVFKPVAEVGEDDIPPWWMKAALAAGDGIECDCC